MLYFMGAVLLVPPGVRVCRGQDGNAGVELRVLNALRDGDERVLRRLVLFKQVVVIFLKL